MDCTRSTLVLALLDYDTNILAVGTSCWFFPSLRCLPQWWLEGSSTAFAMSMDFPKPALRILSVKRLSNETLSPGGLVF